MVNIQNDNRPAAVSVLGTPVDLSALEGSGVTRSKALKADVVLEQGLALADNLEALIIPNRNNGLEITKALDGGWYVQNQALPVDQLPYVVCHLNSRENRDSFTPPQLPLKGFRTIEEATKGAVAELVQVVAEKPGEFKRDLWKLPDGGGFVIHAGPNVISVIKRTDQAILAFAAEYPFIRDNFDLKPFSKSA